MTPTTESKPTVLDQDFSLESRELMALALLQALRRTPETAPLPMACTSLGITVGAHDWDSLAASSADLAWRQNFGLRSDIRCLQVCVLDELSKAGFIIKPPKEKDVLANCIKLVTTPAHPAYDLKAELQG